MYAFLLSMIAVLLLIKKSRETFLVKAMMDGLGLPKALVVGGNKSVSFDPYSQDGYELINFKNTCPLDKPDEDAGLCYERCRPGYRGVGPVCWLETSNVGVGVPVGLAPCPPGWTNMGLTCMQPIRCASGLKFFTEGCSGGRSVGRLDPFCPDKYRIDKRSRKGWDGAAPEQVTHGYDISQANCRSSKEKEFKKTRGVCEGQGATTSDHPDYVDGLCYRSCPKDKPFRVGGMPYLCSVGGDLSYTRGVGTIPPIVRINAGVNR